MKIFRGIKRIIKPHVDVPRWVGYRTLTNTGQSIFDFSKGLFKIKRPQRQETFEQAMQRLKLTENDIHERRRLFLGLAWLFLLLAVAIFFYGCYAYWGNSWSNVVLAFATGSLSLGLAFRYHFWYFQIQQRTLGCTFKMWWTKGIMKQ